MNDSITLRETITLILEEENIPLDDTQNLEVGLEILTLIFAVTRSVIQRETATAEGITASVNKYQIHFENHPTIKGVIQNFDAILDNPVPIDFILETLETE
jgi:hypothetical protein